MTTASICREVEDERVRQVAKWGEQNHPNGTGKFAALTYVESRHGGVMYRTPPRSFGQLADFARRRCDYLHERGRGTWEQILTEEVFEAYAEADPILLRAELIQVAAVAVAWVEAIDREVTRRLTALLTEAIPAAPAA